MKEQPLEKEMMDRNKQFNLQTVFRFMLLALLVVSFMDGTAQTAIENGKLRFGNGYENSVNSTGNLQQPFYYSVEHNGWRRLTFSNISLNQTVAFGGDGTNDWNTGGTSISDCSLTNQTVNSTGFEYSDGTSGSGSGVVISKGTLATGGQILEVENTYTIEASSFITVKTKITNIGSITIENLRYWIGTRDDYVGSEDDPTKERGNLANGSFASISNPAIQAKAIRIKTAQEGVLLFSPSERTQTIINSCCAWENVLNQNPATAPVTITSDGSYGIYVRMNDLAPGDNDEFTWYYGASNLADLDNVVSEVSAATEAGEAVGAVGIVTCNSAVYEAQSNLTGTGYLMTVPDGSVAPTALQIKAGTTYGDVAPVSATSQVINADELSVFNISNLNSSTTYQTYFALEATNGSFIDVISANITTAGNPQVTFSLTEANCTYSGDGVLTASATNGTEPFLYQWTDGPADATYNELNAGVYEVLATDANNCQVTATAAVTVLDTIKPNFFLESVELELNSEGVASLSQEMLLPCASDNCGVAEVEIQNQFFSCEYLQEESSTEVVVLDSQGNSIQKTLLVSVVDVSNPEVEVNEIEIELNHDGIALLTVQMLELRERDNCGIASRTLSKTQFSCKDLGTSVVVITVSDFSGNVTNTSFKVNVLDRMAPQIIQPEPIEMCEGILETVSIIVSDNCSAHLVQIDGPIPGKFLSQGIYELKYLAIDASGNEASLSVSLTVLAKPKVDLGADIQKEAGNSVALVAGDYEDAIYLWSTGETDKEITVEVTESMSISVEVISESGCTNQDAVFIELLSPLGVEDYDKGEINVFPNPTADQLNVVFSGPENLEGVAVQLFDMNGKVVYAQNSASFVQSQPSVLDTSNLSKGVYVLSLQSDKINATQRIVKQ